MQQLELSLFHKSDIQSHNDNISLVLRTVSLHKIVTKTLTFLNGRNCTHVKRNFEYWFKMLEVIFSTKQTDRPRNLLVNFNSLNSNGKSGIRHVCKLQTKKLK